MKSRNRPGRSGTVGLAWLVTLWSALAAPASEASQDTKVVLGNGRDGLAFRVMWFEREDPDAPAQVSRFDFPVASDYACQEIRAVHPVPASATTTRDPHGNVTMSVPTPVEVPEDAPCVLGFVNEIVLYSSAVLEVKPRRVRRDDLPDDLLEFVADDPILTLTDPAITGLVAALSADADTELEYVRSVWRHVYQTVSYGRVERPNTAAQVLEWRKGQCGEYGKLTIALLRANGIPARGVWCLRAGNTGPAANDHAWAEAWVRGIGWMPVRPQEELPADDRYPLAYHTYPIVCRPRCGMDEYRGVEVQNADIPTGWRGVGFFADVPRGKCKESAELFQEIAADRSGDDARSLLRRAAKAHRAVQPMLYWVLAGSRDESVGRASAAALVEIAAEPARRLDLARFEGVSPRVVRERIERARDD